MRAIAGVATEYSLQAETSLLNMEISRSELALTAHHIISAVQYCHVANNPLGNLGKQDS